MEIQGLMQSHNELTINLVFFGFSFLLVFIHAYNRIFETSKDDTLGDALGNYIMAIKAIWQKSINPKLTSYENLQGHYSYPLAFPWICGQLAKTILKNISIRKRSTVKQLLTSLDEKDADELDKSLILMKCLSGLILPIVGQIISIFMVYRITGPTILGIISTCALLSILDALFTDKSNMMSSRNAGFIYYLTYSWSIVLAMSETKIQIINTTIETDILVRIVFAICSLGLFQTSQRYFQCFVATSMILMYLKPEYCLDLLVLFALANFILLQIPKADYGAAVKSHIYNRIHDAEWSNRLYGHFRYGFMKRLKSGLHEAFMEDALKYKYLRNSMASLSYYKRNLVSGFLVHRVYIFNIMLLLGFKNELMENTQVMILLTVLSAVIPSIICFYKPFQGYGSSEVYVWSNLPLGILTLAWSLNEISLNQANNISGIQIAILILIALDIVLMSVSSVANKIRIAIRVKPKLQESALLDGFMTDFGMAKNIGEIVRFVEGTSKSINKGRLDIKNISIMCNEIHTQCFAEVLIAYINKLKLKNLTARPGFTPIDNYYYGYFQDYVGFNINPNLTLNRIKPDILVLNSSVGMSNRLLQHFANEGAEKVIFRSGALYVISVSGLLRVKDGRLQVGKRV